MNKQERQIANWLKNIKFRKKIFGGVDEQDVWKKIEELHEMYEQALTAERIRYDLLLEQNEINSGNTSHRKKSPEKKRQVRKQEHHA